jgi:hypothetical protein
MGPFTFARCENSIRITAVIGTGLIATPIAKVKTLLMPCPIRFSVTDSSREAYDMKRQRRRLRALNASEIFPTSRQLMILRLRTEVTVLRAGPV